MASITKRGNSWVACWKQAGQTVKRTTGIRVKEPGMSAARAEQLARQTAQMMEAAAKGDSPCQRAMAAVRAAAVAMGAAQRLPTVREYLEAVPVSAGEKAEANRRRAFRRLLEFLGAAADAPLDMVSVELCEQFLRAMLREVSRGTAEGHRVYLSAAWNRAINVLGIIERNPWSVVSATKLARGLQGGESLARKRLPFTLDEMRRLMSELQAPWCDMVAVSWYAFGLRLADVCLMRWNDIHWDAGYIHLIEKKTKKDRCLPMSAELRARLLSVRSRQAENEEYVFPLMAHYFNAGCAGYVSTQFTALLRAMGIIGEPERVFGRRHSWSTKSFHSIRHAVVSCLRASGTFTADIVRDAVGHDSERVERGYFTATQAQRAAVGAALASAVASPLTPAPEKQERGNACK